MLQEPADWSSNIENVLRNLSAISNWRSTIPSGDGGEKDSEMNFSETNLTENLPHSGEEVYATYSRLHTGFAIVRPPETSRDDGAYVDDSVLRSAQIEQLYSHASSGI